MQYRPRFRVSPIYGETNNLRTNNSNSNQNQRKNSNEDNNSNNNKINGNNNINNNNENNENNIDSFTQFSDQDITINYSNCCKTPYFIFGKSIFFYCPHSLSNKNDNGYYTSNTKLSLLPDPLFYFGPEYKTFFGCSACMYITMIIFVIIEFAVIEILVFEILTLVLFIGAVFSGIHVFLKNPGISFKHKGKNTKYYYCDKCKFSYPFIIDKNFEHCYSCGVCLQGLDHHCGVFGKCIGRKNLISFYLFPIFSTILCIEWFISLMYYVVNIVIKK